MVPSPAATSLLELLQRAAATQAGITFYKAHGPSESSPEQISYRQLLDQACRDAAWLQTSVSGLQRDTVFLLHFDSHEENIRWFWATTVAGYVPCIVPKLAVSNERRIAQAEHILRLLDGPVILTNDRMACAFKGVEAHRLYRVDDLVQKPTFHAETATTLPSVIHNQRDDDLGALMLTSGSTGFSKAVCLRQPQMLAAAAGKAAHCRATSEDVFLSWIALDHVVNLVEMHLHAMLLGADQIQVATEEVLKEPRQFLDLVDRHRVSLSFAPNFFLALLCERVSQPDFVKEGSNWDLSCLRCVFSGGEATVRQMAVQLTRALQPYGAQPFIRAGYGLTESCAGMVWDLVDHTLDGLYDASGEFLSCGLPIPGVQMRVVREMDGMEAVADEEGMLQLRGPVMFNRYYRDPAATSAAFTADGWFITGDNAILDKHGQLYITGRTKDTLLINGLTIFAVEVEYGIEQARITGLTPSYTLVFAHRPAGAVTESYCVVYSPSYSSDDDEARAQTTDAIERIASLVVNVKPAAILPLPRQYFEKTSLGKLSRAHFRRLFENGTFDSERAFHTARLQAYRQAHRQPPSSPTEQTILDLVCTRLAVDPHDVSVTTNLFQLGLSSLDFYTITQDLHRNFDTHLTLPDLLADPTISGLARHVSTSTKTMNAEYDPVVTLQPHGSKTPLWLVHPASGNVLIFTALARAFHDRPIYGFRARGTKPGENLFTSITEMADTYVTALVRTQPHGPYALAGYSLGSSVTFEIAKRLEASGAEVQFLGALDGPPDIAPLVGHLTWSEALVMIGYFYELIEERRSIQLMSELRDQDPEVALDVVLGEADQERVKVLGLEKEELTHVTDVTAGFCRAAGEYVPSEEIGCVVDVFAVEPLLTVTDQREVWVRDYLGKWASLSKSGMAVHQCEGRHADMLGREFVNSLALILRRVMSARGV
ncbi:uncharacterized protein N7458_005744 [Penicillium daleae]|uniref:Carrier domain-containing protein n=1 Tax=Penicillium daleae TaxID=63821 RepID=A0AAD6C8S3_9EURO|nr:uncharacterized protein N7458_005744 [Penicillium daleae]KAJ5454788.1 hypothetical protein N7458_005744 [Penicillium daleae]